MVGFLHFFISIKFGILLIGFFLTSSKLTKVGSEKKKIIDSAFLDGGQRNHLQVFANSFSGLLPCILYYYYFGHNMSNAPLSHFLHGAILGHYGCCAGDTWSSELGVLSLKHPVLITTFNVVPVGTNGGISVVGTLAALCGGLCMGIILFLFDYSYLYILYGSLAGLFGSLLDSLLGATLQYSGWNEDTKKVENRPNKNLKLISGVDLLSNGQVNFLSALITSIITGYLCMCFGL